MSPITAAGVIPGIYFSNNNIINNIRKTERSEAEIMARVVASTKWTTTVYDLEGKASECSLIDAKERVATGRWTYESPEQIVEVKETEDNAVVTEVAAEVAEIPEAEEAEAVKKNVARGGNRNRKK